MSELIPENSIPSKICLSCGEQYQARGSCCGKPRCKKWVHRHPGEIRGSLSVGGFIPKFLKPILDDENLVKLLNKGNENRATVKDDLDQLKKRIAIKKRDARLPGAVTAQGTVISHSYSRDIPDTTIRPAGVSVY